MKKLIIILMIILLLIFIKFVHPERITELPGSLHPAFVTMNDNRIYFTGRTSLLQVKNFFHDADTNKIIGVHKKGGNHETN
jgi:hypothetical protein